MLYASFMNITFIKLGLLLSAFTLLSSCSSNQTKSKPIDSLKLVIPDKNKYDSTVFEPIYNKLISGDTLSKLDIENFSKDIETRADFYTLLKEFHKESLFPGEYYSFEKAAESVLTNWLLYPTELDTIPSKIEVVKQVSFVEHDTTFIYYVLRFKTEEPHWAAKDGWMMGVVGPYFKDSKPYDWTSGTFSKFSKAKETTPEKEVEWAHKNVFRRSPE
jgi:hypothetical protein